MNLEQNPMDPALDDAMKYIHDEPVDDAVIEAAAARVWANLARAGPYATPQLRGFPGPDPGLQSGPAAGIARACW